MHSQVSPVVGLYLLSTMQRMENKAQEKSAVAGFTQTRGVMEANLCSIIRNDCLLQDFADFREITVYSKETEP